MQKLNKFAFTLALGAASFAQAYTHQEGMVVNLDKASGNGPTVDPVQNAKLQNMHIKSVRLWVSIFGWEREWKGTAYNLDTLITWPGAIEQVKRFKASGYHVVLAVVGDNGLVPKDTYVRPDGSILTYDKAVELQLSHLVDRYGLGNLVDVWEIGNEPDNNGYWKDGKPNYSKEKMENYTDRMLIPAARYLHARGLKVMTGAPSWNPDNVANIVQRLKATPINNAGPSVTSAFDLVDYVGYHPYRPLNMMQADVNRAKVAASGKPMIASEWFVQSKACYNVPVWNEENAQAYAIISKAFAYAHYYTLSPDSNPDGASSCNSVLMLDNSPRVVNGGRGMYDVLVKESLTSYDVADWNGPNGAAPAPAPTPAPSPVPAPNPAVTSFDLYDDDSKQVVNHLTSAHSVDIDLASVSLRNIALLAGASNAGSVSFKYERLVNGSVVATSQTSDGSSPFAVFGDNGSASNPVFTTIPATVGEHRVTIVPYANGVGSFAGPTAVYSIIIRDTRVVANPPTGGVNLPGNGVGNSANSKVVNVLLRAGNSTSTLLQLTTSAVNEINQQSFGTNGLRLAVGQSYAGSTKFTVVNDDTNAKLEGISTITSDEWKTYYPAPTATAWLPDAGSYTIYMTPVAWGGGDLRGGFGDTQVYKLRVIGTSPTPPPSGGSSISLPGDGVGNRADSRVNNLLLRVAASGQNIGYMTKNQTLSMASLGAGAQGLVFSVSQGYASSVKYILVNQQTGAKIEGFSNITSTEWRATVPSGPWVPSVGSYSLYLTPIAWPNGDLSGGYGDSVSFQFTVVN